MRAIVRYGLPATLSLALAAASRGQQPGSSGRPPLPEELSQRFAYDAAHPLDVQGKVVEKGGGLALHDVTYASPKGGRVTAYLLVPEGKGPFAGILFGHWGPGNRTEFLPEAMLYARAGAVCLLVDYPWTRPAPWRRDLLWSQKPENDLEVETQAVVDLRRAFDVLAARPDVDPKRLGYVGHSFGAQFGAILSAVDRRMKVAVLAGGIPDAAAIYRESDDPELVEMRKSQPERITKYLDVMAPMNAVRYVPHAAPIPLYFQFARFEQNFTESAMRRYFSAASEPKREKWYPTGHDLNDPQALLDRAGWLKTHIGIAAVSLPAGVR